MTIAANGEKVYTPSHIAAVAEYLRAGPYALSDFAVQAIIDEGAALGATIRQQRADRDAETLAKAMKALRPAPVTPTSKAEDLGPYHSEESANQFVLAMYSALSDSDFTEWAKSVEKWAAWRVPIVMLNHIIHFVAQSNRGTKIQTHRSPI